MRYVRTCMEHTTICKDSACVVWHVWIIARSVVEVVLVHVQESGAF